MTLFDIISDVLLKKSGELDKDIDFDKTMNSYMFIRFLSMRDKLIPYVEILNKVQCSINKIQIYKLAYQMIPKQSSGFIKYYCKKDKKKNETETDSTEDSV